MKLFFIAMLAVGSISAQAAEVCQVRGTLVHSQKIECSDTVVQGQLDQKKSLMYLTKDLKELGYDLKTSMRSDSIIEKRTFDAVIVSIFVKP